MTYDLHEQAAWVARMLREQEKTMPKAVRRHALSEEHAQKNRDAGQATYQTILALIAKKEHING